MLIGYFTETTEPYQTLPNLIKPYQALPNLTKPYRTLPSLTEPYQTLPILTKPYGTLPSLTEPYQYLPNFTKPYRTLPILTQPYQAYRTLPDTIKYQYQNDKLKIYQITTVKSGHKPRFMPKHTVGNVGFANSEIKF